MPNKRRRLSDLVVGAIAVLVLLVPFLYKNGAFLPVPYGDVDRTFVVAEGDKIHYSANFTKYSGCTFVRLAVFGDNLGRWEDVKWEDVKRGGQGAGDRVAGKHTIDIYILGDNKYSAYDIRTEHACGDERVDRIFDEFRASEIE